MRLVVEAREVDAELERLDLNRTLLAEVVQSGELERVSCTEMDPVSYSGTAAWAIHNRTLGRLLSRQGWRRLNLKNLPLTVDPVSGVAITVTSGSPGTGSPMGEPTTKYDKGAVFRRQVAINRRQGLLFGDERQFTKMPEPGDLAFWLLMVCAEYRPGKQQSDLGRHVAKAELSFPSEIDEKGFVTRWGQRIILDPVQLDNVPRVVPLDYEVDDELEVTIRRR